MNPHEDVVPAQEAGNAASRPHARRNSFVGTPLPKASRPLRLGLMLDLAPRKLGSFEEWMLAVCTLARERGHAVDVACRQPIHPEVRARLASLEVGLLDVTELELQPLQTVQRLRGYDVLEFNHFGLRAPLMLLAYAAWPARVLYVDRSSGLAEDARRPLARRLVSAGLDRLTLLRLGGVAGVSDYVRERDRTRFGSEARVQTLYNGINLERFRPLRLARSPGARFRLVAVAHLIRHKGVDTLLRALARMRERNTELVVIGDGPEAASLQALTRELGLTERVQMGGLRSDVHEVLARADVFVHPATWQEAFGYTIAEAMACGLPVVASRIGGIPEVVSDGESGLLFTPGDDGELAQVLDALLADEALRNRLGAAGRERVERLFDVGVSARRHVAWMEAG